MGSTEDAATPEGVDAGSAELGPSCISAEVRKEGRILAVELAAGGALHFCVRKGFYAEAPRSCLLLRPEEKRFEAAAELWPGFRFAELPPEPEDKTSALHASAAGTLRVCASSGQCATLRLRPPARDAWDEVFGLSPAVTVEGTSRVLVARLKETYLSRERPPKLEVFVDAIDVKRGAKVASARIARDQSPIDLRWLGKSALLQSCELDGGPCHAFVIDPKSLASKKLPVELDAPSALGTGRMSELVLRAATNEWLLVDAGGRKVISIDESGAVTRSVDLGATSDPEYGAPRAGFRSERELVVLQAGPSAGRVSLVDLQSGTATHFDAPSCP